MAGRGSAMANRWPARRVQPGSGRRTMVFRSGGAADAFGPFFAGRVRRGGVRKAVAPGPDVAFLAGGPPDLSIFGEGTLRGMASAVVGVVAC